MHAIRKETTVDDDGALHGVVRVTLKHPRVHYTSVHRVAVTSDPGRTFADLLDVFRVARSFSRSVGASTRLRFAGVTVELDARQTERELCQLTQLVTWRLLGCEVHCLACGNSQRVGGR